MQLSFTLAQGLSAGLSLIVSSFCFSLPSGNMHPEVLCSYASLLCDTDSCVKCYTVLTEWFAISPDLFPCAAFKCSTSE